MDQDRVDYIVDELRYIRVKVDKLDEKFASKDLVHSYARWFGGVLAAVTTTFWTFIEHIKH